MKDNSYSIEVKIWNDGKLSASATLLDLPAKNIKTIMGILQPEIFAQPRDSKGHFIKPTDTDVEQL